MLETGRHDSPLIETASLGFAYAGQARPVLKDVDLVVGKREVLAVTGASGCGKTTLLKLLAGLLRPQWGTVKFRGETISGPSRRVAMVFQNALMFPWFTVRQNIGLALSPRDASGRSASVAELLQLVGLPGELASYPGELSGGMARRAALATALAREPDLVLLDEPFSGLDVRAAHALARNLRALMWQDLQGMVIVTHSVEEMFLLAHRVMVLGQDGAIRAELPLDGDPWTRDNGYDLAPFRRELHYHLKA